VAVAAILLAGGLASHQAGKIDLFRVRRQLPIVHPEHGFAFVSPTGVEWPERTFATPPRLFEDDRPLGPGEARPRDIRNLGKGRYGFWESSLYFSSSDGTDPRTNGRRYHFEGPWPLSRRTASLFYVLLGIVVALALRPWLSPANLLRSMARTVSPREPSTAEALSGKTTPGYVVSGFAEVDDMPLQRWERRLVVVLVIGLAVVVVVWLLASPQLASMTLEYALKFVPLLADGPASSILDFNGAGDPRGRVVNSLLTWINIRARKELLLTTAIHPALSINWLLYPLTLVVLNKAVRRMSKGPRYGIIVTLLYAASPGMLDTLVDYYLPAKALVNFWFAGALYGVSMLVPTEHAKRSVLGAVLFGATTFLGLLSDETAIFIPISVCLLFGRQILFGAEARRRRVLVAASLVVAFSAYGLAVLVAVPLANAVLQQAPLDLPTSVLQGPYAAMFGGQPRTLGNTLKYYAPLSLLETIVSAHFVPGRVVTVAWTSHLPYKLPWLWSLHEQLALCGLVVVIVALVHLLPAECKPLIWRLGGTFSVYVAVQSLLLVALSGYVCESGYYAALASILLALAVGAIAAGSSRSQGMRALSWSLVAYVMAVQLANMVDTATRHPYFGVDPLTWRDLKTVHSKIGRGEVDQALAAQPFPSRRFLYAFEVAAAFESVRGHRIDFLPMEEPQDGLARHLDVDRIADPTIAPMGGPLPRDEKEVTNHGLLAKSIDARYFHTGAIRGETGVWGYEWRFDGSGEVVQRSWRYGLMRLWSATGRVEQRAGEVCLVFSTAPTTCFESLYQHGEWILAFGADGRLVTRFRWES
jgi:hypothetical protein